MKGAFLHAPRSKEAPSQSIHDSSSRQRTGDSMERLGQDVQVDDNWN